MNYQELIERLRNEHVTGFNLTVAACKAATAIESLLAENERLKHNLTSTEQTMREYQALAAERLEEIEKLKEDNFVLEDELGYACQWKTEFREQLEYAKKELAKYRDAPVVAWHHEVEGLSYENHYVGNIPLIVKPGEEK